MGPRSGMGTGLAKKPGNGGGVKVPTVSRSRVGKHPLYPGERRRMARDLTRIGEKARAEPKTCFTSIYHLVKEVDLLRACYQQAEKGKAPGVDGVSRSTGGTWRAISKICPKDWAGWLTVRNPSCAGISQNPGAGRSGR